MKKNIPHQPLLLFDGVCNLCNNSINYIIKKDTKNVFKFASLQSDVAKKILLQFDSTNFDLSSIVLVDHDKLYFKSTAILKAGKHLGGIYKICYFFIVIPRPIRDLIYDYIAKNRYKWYGKKESCMIPTPELKEKFID